MLTDSNGPVMDKSCLVLLLTDINNIPHSIKPRR